jgi:hypothetical protein
MSAGRRDVKAHYFELDELLASTAAGRSVLKVRLQGSRALTMSMKGEDLEKNLFDRVKGIPCERVAYDLSVARVVSGVACDADEHDFSLSLSFPLTMRAQQGFLQIKQEDGHWVTARATLRCTDLVFHVRVRVRMRVSTLSRTLSLPILPPLREYFHRTLHVHRSSIRQTRGGRHRRRRLFSAYVT